MLKPVFKWMGGKRKMMPLYESQLNVNLLDIREFHDMFAGSLAASMWAYERMPNAQIYIHELNPFLVGLYETIRDHTDEFITQLYKLVDEFCSIPVEKELDKKGHRHLRKRYDWYRGALHRLNGMYQMNLNNTHPWLFYALQYLLQRISFGGAWQTNKELAPTYATPSGSLTATRKGLNNGADIIAVAKFLQDPRVHLKCGDFSQCNPHPGNQTMVFADPPYVNTEHKYGSKFKESDQKDLCKLLRQYSDYGINVLMTNAPWSEWDNLLPGFKQWSKDHTYTVGQGQVMTKELLISNCLK